QSYGKEGKALRRGAGGYAHARQFRRLRKVLRRQRTILGRLLRDVCRKMEVLPEAVRERLGMWVARAERLHGQRAKDKGKLYALHAPEVECIGKGKARQPYEFGGKVSVAISHGSGLVVGARSFPGNPYDGHTLAEQLEQTRILLEDVEAVPHTAYTDLGFRGVDGEIGEVNLIHRGKLKTLSKAQRTALKRRQAIEPVIGHMKQDNGMGRCWLKGAQGDALDAVLAAARSEAVPHTAYTDLGFRGVDGEIGELNLIHRGKLKTLSKAQRTALKRRQAIEPVIGHMKQDNGMGRCWLKGAQGDALDAVLAAAGYNLRWLLRAIAEGRVNPVFLRVLHAWLARRIGRRNAVIWPSRLLVSA